MTTTIVIIIIVAILAIWLVSIYNRLVKLRNNRENAFANIDVQLKQRCDLIPQLVATVKGYATHEKETLQRVTEAALAGYDGFDVTSEKNYFDEKMMSVDDAEKFSLISCGIYNFPLYSVMVLLLMDIAGKRVLMMIFMKKLKKF